MKLTMGRDRGHDGRGLRRARRWTGWVAGLVVALSACHGRDDNGDFTDEEWERIASLSTWTEGDPAILQGIGRPPADPSNRFVSTDAYPVAGDGTLSPAASLGKMFFFDPRFSGTATASDWLGRVRPENAHVPAGAPLGLACVSCHDLARAASDPLASPISLGAGSIAANAPPLVNAAFFPLLHANGRVDSLWSQALLVTEAGIVLNASRLQVAWTLWRSYRQAYQAVVGELPFGESEAVMRDLVAHAPASRGLGACTVEAGGACSPGCAPVNGFTGCWPRFPYQGAPRAKTAGEACADPTDPSPTCCVSPLATPYNCMSAADRAAVDRTFVTFGKLVASFEQTLVRGGSAFDRFVHEGRGSQTLTPAARRGAALFVTKGGCYDCHNTPLLSNRGFAGIGVASSGSLDLTPSDCPAGSPVCDCFTGGAASLTSCLPWGAATGLELLRRFPLRRDSAASDAPDDRTVKSFLATAWPALAHGAPDATGIPDPLPKQLKWAWRIPGLRDVALTAPYMHNGRYATLREVVDHYDRGGDVEAPGTPDAQIKPLALTEDEKQALVAFLESLTSAPWPASLTSAPSLPEETP